MFRRNTKNVRTLCLEWTIIVLIYSMGWTRIITYRANMSVYNAIYNNYNASLPLNLLTIITDFMFQGEYVLV